MSDRVHPLLFAALLGAACGLVLQGVAAVTGPAARRNEEALLARAVLSALGVPPPAGEGEVLELFSQRVRAVDAGGGRFYVLEEGGVPVACAVEVRGRGLWGPMRGIVAVSADGRRIRGVSIFEHSETPGLGAEVASPEFARRFAGRLVRRSGITITRPGTARRPGEVDGITGATVTSRRVGEMVNEGLSRLARWREGLAGGS